MKTPGFIPTVLAVQLALLPIASSISASEANPTPPGSVLTLTQTIEKSEVLWADSRFDEAGKLLDHALDGAPKSTDLLWRLARVYYEMGEILPPDDRDARLRTFGTAEAYARRCIEADPEEGECHFWLGAAVGRRSTTKGLLNSARAGKEIESSFQRAIKLGLTYRSSTGHSSLANAHYALGQFYRLVPDLWIIKLLTGVRGDMDRSVDHMRKAVVIETERLEFTKELGVALICNGERNDRPELIEEGKATLTKVASLPVTEPSDLTDKTHAQMLLADPSLCCRYSRDGQKGLSDDELKKVEASR